MPEKSSPRSTAYIHFLLSFLVATGDSAVAKEFLDKRAAKLAQIFQGLTHDSCSTATLVLTALRDRVAENPTVTKTAKMRLFGASNLAAITQLLDYWTGPKKNVKDGNLIFFGLNFNA